MSSVAFNMKERKEPEFVKFTEGEVVEGELISIQQIDVADPVTGVSKKAIRYTLQDLESGDLSCFLGAYQIDTKLRRTDVGHMVSIRYEGEDRNIGRNGNKMKRFKIHVSDQAVRAMAAASGVKLDDSTMITDDDIPF